MIGPVDGLYHMYLPLYLKGLLYHPVEMLHGTARERTGPWTWRNLTGVDVSFNPGALVYGEGERTRYTLWTSKPDGSTVGAVFHSSSPAGPFVEIPGSNNTGCSINPSPLFVDGQFFCTGQKGGTIMTAPHLGGPWAEYANITDQQGEDPHLCASEIRTRALLRLTVRDAVRAPKLGSTAAPISDRD
jgi:hypothetical protein